MIKRVSLAAPAIAAILTAGTTGASAQSIVEPEVVKGQTKLETFHVLQSGFNHGAAGDTREFHSFTYSYGLTDFWQVKAFLGVERPDGRSHDTTVAVLENTFEILNAKKNGGIGLGWFTGVAMGLNDDQTSVVAYGPVVRLGAGPTSLILNPFVEQTFGRNHEEGLAFLYGWQLKHQLRTGFWLGIEGFGSIHDVAGEAGPERHRIGPLLTYEIDLGQQRSLPLETGVQLGLTDATPDTAVKAQVTYTFGG